jgi:PTS system nitrogen regulatory IIA component
MKLSLHQVAHALDTPLETIERWIRQGRIPIRRFGDKYIFNTTTLEKWANQRKLPFVIPSESEKSKSSTLSETLMESMQLGGIFYEIEGNDIQTALASAVDVIPKLSHQDRKELYDRLIKRETLASTGVGKGIAMPHPRTPMSSSLTSSQITTCFLKAPINFNAVDDQPVFIFFILLSPSVKQHLHLLSHLSFCVRNNEFVTFLKQKPQTHDIFQKIADFELTLDSDG